MYLCKIEYVILNGHSSHIIASFNEGDYLGQLGHTVRLRDRLQGGERWVIVWRSCECTLAGM